MAARFYCARKSVQQDLRQRSVMSYPLQRKLVVEFVGMFLFLFTVGMATESANKTGALLAPIAIGSVLMLMVFAGGHVSGGHYNPAVSTAVFLRGKIQANEFLAYILTQFAAAALAGLLVNGIGGKQVAGATATTGKMLVVEFLFTFALAYVVLNVATAKGTAGNSFYGLAIGFTVVVGAISVGWISGGAFNPAIALGASVFGAFKWSHIWIYVLAGFLGGAAAAGAFLFVQAEHAGEN
jgi:aquaporin Z